MAVKAPRSSLTRASRMEFAEQSALGHRSGNMFEDSFHARQDDHGEVGSLMGVSMAPTSTYDLDRELKVRL